MSEFLDRILGFMPQRGTFWMAFSMVVFMLIFRRLNEWVTKKVQLPWMEEKNQQQRKAMDKEKSK